MKTRSMILSGLAIAALISGLSYRAEAFPAFATKEKKACGYCHLKAGGGGARGFRGIYYKAHTLSFKGFVEATQAKKAGVKVNAMDAATKPTKPYSGK